MLSIVLGISTALIYGFADFFGAIGSRRLRPILVTALAAFGGLGFLAIAVWGFGVSSTFSPGALFWGSLGGAISAVGLSSLYKALAEGPIAILSPLSAVISAIVPAAVGIAQGEKFNWHGWLAIALILVAIVLVAFVPGTEVRMPSAAGLFYGTMAGLGIGFVMVSLHEAPADSGIAPVIMVRVVNGVLLVGAAAVLIMTNRAKLQEFTRLSPRLWGVIMAAGVCDAGANILFMTGVHQGSLTVVSVLTALYPLGTILLARLVLKEKVAASQLVGIGLALGACALLAL